MTRSNTTQDLLKDQKPWLIRRSWIYPALTSWNLLKTGPERSKAWITSPPVIQTHLDGSAGRSTPGAWSRLIFQR